jgi:NADH-ubiquinone oxidoreductase chain 5
MAFPFFTGFYSKDFILELALIPKNMTYTIGYILILLAAILTATYSSRLLIMTFISKPNFPRTSLNIIMDPSPLMLIPLFILA